MRPAIQGDEFLPFDLKLNRHDRASGSSGGFFTGFVVASDFAGLGFFEDGCVEFYRLFGVVVEPKGWSDLLHNVSQILFSKIRRTNRTRQDKLSRHLRSVPGSRAQECLRKAATGARLMRIGRLRGGYGHRSL